MRIGYPVLICFMISILIISIPVPRVETGPNLAIGEIHSGDVGILVENKRLKYGDSKYAEELFYTSGSISFTFDVRDDDYTGFSITPKLAVIYHIKSASREATIRFGMHWHSPANFYIKATLDVSTDGGRTWIRPDPDVEEGDLSEFKSGIDIDVPPGDSSVSLGTTGDTLSWSWDRSIGVTHVRVNIEYYEIGGYIRAGLMYLSTHKTHYEKISASAHFQIVLSEGGDGGGGDGEDNREVYIEVVADDQDTYYSLTGIKVTARDPYGTWRYDDYTNETGFVHFERSGAAGWLANVSLWVDEVFYGFSKDRNQHPRRHVVEYRRWKDWKWVVDDPVYYKKKGVCWIEWRMGIGYVWIRCLYMPKAIPVLKYLLDGTGEGRLLSEFGNPIEKEGWRQIRRIKVYLREDPLNETLIPVAEIRTDVWGNFNLNLNSSLFGDMRYMLLYFTGEYFRKGIGWYWDYWYSPGVYQLRIGKLTIRVLTTDGDPLKNYPVVVYRSEVNSIKYTDSNGYASWYAYGYFYARIPDATIGGRKYTFSHWGDGSKDNPRSVSVEEDVDLIAYVKPTVKSTTLSLSSDKYRLFEGGSFTLTAELRDQEGNPISNAEIEFYESRDSTNWRLISTRATDSEGRASLTLGRSSGVYYYKAVFNGTDEYKPSHSNIVRIDVLPGLEGYVLPGLSINPLRIPKGVWLINATPYYDVPVFIRASIGRAGEGFKRVELPIIVRADREYVLMGEAISDREIHMYRPVVVWPPEYTGWHLYELEAGDFANETEMSKILSYLRNGTTELVYGISLNSTFVKTVAISHARSTVTVEYTRDVTRLILDGVFMCTTPFNRTVVFLSQTQLPVVIALNYTVGYLGWCRPGGGVEFKHDDMYWNFTFEHITVDAIIRYEWRGVGESEGMPWTEVPLCEKHRFILKPCTLWIVDWSDPIDSSEAYIVVKPAVLDERGNLERYASGGTVWIYYDPPGIEEYIPIRDILRYEYPSQRVTFLMRWIPPSAEDPIEVYYSLKIGYEPKT